MVRNVKILNAKFQKYMITKFQFHAILSTMIKSHSVLLHSTWDMIPFVQYMAPVSQLVVSLLSRQLLRFHSTRVQITLILLNNGLKCKTSDAGILYILLLCLVCELNFIIRMNGKKHSIYRFHLWFQSSTVVLEGNSHREGRTNVL